MNIQQMMKQAQQMQERLQKKMAELRVEASAGGGMVTVGVNGAKQIQSVKIDPEVVSKDDVEMLQDLIAAAINDASRKVDEQLGQSMSGLLGGLNITDADPCVYCTSASRDQRVICVVEEPQNVSVVEKTREFRGVYHVLMGALSPLHGVGPDDLKIQGLLQRVGTGAVEEVILATNPTVEGEATALYLARLLKPLGVRVTRIAMGIPVGSDLEYADEVTMTRAMENRRDL